MTNPENNKQTHESDSSVQRKVESEVKIYLHKKHGWNLSANEREFSSKYELDFCDLENKIMGEIYAGIDKVNPAQKNKVKADLLKLIAAERDFGNKWEKHYVFVDKNVEKAFIGDSWLGDAIKSFNIKLSTVSLSDLKPGIEAELREAKAKQQRGNQTK